MEMKKLVLGLVVFLLSLNGKAQEGGLFWRLTSAEGKQSYLFGTYHLMGSDFVKEDRPEVLSAFESSESLVVETVIDSTKLPSMMSYYVMPKHSIEALVSEEDYTLLKEKLEPVMGAPLKALDKLKPAVLSTAYTLHVMQKATPDSLQREGLPLDLFFADQGKRNHKVIHTLESMEEQMEVLMNSQTPEEQMKELLRLVKDEQGTFEDAQNLVAAYISDDLSRIEGLGEDYEEVSGNMDALIVKRNRNWIPKLKKILNEGNSFIAVGALHLSGEEGLVELLRAEGFKLEAL